MPNEPDDPAPNPPSEQVRQEIFDYLRTMPENVLLNYIRITRERAEEGLPTVGLKMNLTDPMDKQVADLAESLDVPVYELVKDVDEDR